MDAECLVSCCIGKDFDFYGATAKVANTINEEHMIFSRQAPKKQQQPPVTATPTNPVLAMAKSPEPIPDLQPEMSLWATGETATNTSRRHAPPAPAPVPAPASRNKPTQPSAAPKKFMSLEEVEAQILAQSQKPQKPATPPHPSIPHVRTLPPLSEPPKLQTYNPELQLYPPPAQYSQHGATPSHHILPEHRLSPQPSGIFNQSRPPRQVGVPPPGGVSTAMPIGISAIVQTDADSARGMEAESRRLRRNYKIAQLVCLIAKHNAQEFANVFFPSRLSTMG